MVAQCGMSEKVGLVYRDTSKPNEDITKEVKSILDERYKHAVRRFFVCISVIIFCFCFLV
jgi:ATP-dependent Zn protease